MEVWFPEADRHGPTHAEYVKFWELATAYLSDFVGNVADNVGDDGSQYDGPKTAEDLFRSAFLLATDTNTVDGVTRNGVEDWLHNNGEGRK